MILNKQKKNRKKITLFKKQTFIDIQDIDLDIINKSQKEVEQESYNIHYESLEKWKTITTLWDNEASRFWMRNNIFLIINSALLMIVALYSKELIINILISSFGIFFTSIWKKVNIVSKSYLNRWKPIIKSLEKNTITETFKHLPDIESRNPRIRQMKTSTKYFDYVLSMFVILWIIIIIYNIIQIILQVY